ncbi:CheR family methyltransferase [Pseudomonas sp. NA-150]|uniref:CheR family methyltransferase n=1 Tax=Pseudomonas sp. NA-150 TaxID=3367525 RepID=UPI0037CA9B79
MSGDPRFSRFLKERIGLDVVSVGEAIIERAVRQRHTATQSEDCEQYWQRLLASADEQLALIEAVIVPETWFFRYPESFVTLGKLAVERLAQLMGARPLRILSLPCSTGEEPYSIAMALFDAGLEARQFQVDAVDISPLSIEKAGRALYGKNSFRGDRLSFRERYFSLEADGYQLDEKVCRPVTFQAGNVLDPDLLAAQPAYDFVFCRNLLIYFDVETQQRALQVLKRWTREEGVLFIGPAEGSLLVRLGMRSTGAAQSFAFSRHTEKVAEATVPFVARPALRPVMPLRVTPRPFASGPLPVVSRPVATPQSLPKDEQASTLLLEIAMLADQGSSAAARAAGERYLQLYEPVAQVFYWLGLLSDLGGQASEAQALYRKALYLEPQHPEALAQLAALLASQGDVAGARRLQARAARVPRDPDGRSKQGSHR